MPRLVEIQTGDPLAAELTVAVGDMLVFDASGGRVSSGSDNVELFGAFVKGIAAGGRVLAPAGSPNALVLRATQSGAADVEIVVGDPWGSRGSMTLRLVVET